MTPEEMLAEVEYDWMYYFEHGHFSDCSMFDPEAEARECSCSAERAMEAIPSDLARQAAIGAAVERLIESDFWWVLGYNISGYEAMLYAGDQLEFRRKAATLEGAVAAAIDAAL